MIMSKRSVPKSESELPTAIHTSEIAPLTVGMNETPKVEVVTCAPP